MKKYLLFLFLIVFTLTQSISQTHTWTGNGDNYFWSDPDNWDQGTVPLTNGVGTVIIPEGFEVRSSSSIDFEYGEFKGGGIFINEGELNLINSDEVLTSKIFSNITIQNKTDIYIYRANGISNTDPVLFNEGAHVISGHNGILLLNSVGISFNTPQPGFLEINGPINKIGEEDVLIDVEMKICCYDFTVSEGLLLIEPKTSNLIISPDIYVNNNASLILSGNNVFSSPGSSLEGIIDGYFEIRSNGIDHPSITGNINSDLEGNITFKEVEFIGGGTIKNHSGTIVIPESANVILDNVTLLNSFNMEIHPQSTITLKNQGSLRSGDSLLIYGGQLISLNNEAFDCAGDVSILNNSTFEILNTNFSNTGVINLGQGTLILDDDSSFVNQFFLEPWELIGEVIGSGTFKFPSYNDQTIDNGGIFSPEPGITTLSTVNFAQTPDGIIRIEIESLSNYDKIVNTGTSHFEGGFEITLNYAPSIGDEFMVYQSDSSLTNCQPISTISAVFNDFNYVFDVICNTDNVTLRLGQILGTNNFEINDYSFYNYPNPMNKETTFSFSTVEDLPQNSTINIYNYLGQLVQKITIKDSENIVFKRKNLSSGIYFAALKSKNRTLAITKLILD